MSAKERAKYGLNMRRFFRSMFEIADLWCARAWLGPSCSLVTHLRACATRRTTSLDHKEYVAFLINLYLRITRRRPPPPPQEKKPDDEPPSPPTPPSEVPSDEEDNATKAGCSLLLVTALNCG